MLRRPGGVRARDVRLLLPPLMVQTASLLIPLVFGKEWRGRMWSKVNASSPLSRRTLLPVAKRLLRWRLGAGRVVWVPGSVTLQPPGKPPPGLLRRSCCAELCGAFASCWPP